MNDLEKECQTIAMRISQSLYAVIVESRLSSIAWFRGEIVRCLDLIIAEHGTMAATAPDRDEAFEHQQIVVVYQEIRSLIVSLHAPNQQS